MFGDVSRCGVFKSPWLAEIFKFEINFNIFHQNTRKFTAKKYLQPTKAHPHPWIQSPIMYFRFHRRRLRYSSKLADYWFIHIRGKYYSSSGCGGVHEWFSRWNFNFHTKHQAEVSKEFMFYRSITVVLTYFMDILSSAMKSGERKKISRLVRKKTINL